MSSIELLSEIITDSSQPITSRRAAVIELAEMSSVQTLPILSQALSDIAPGVRREAATALLRYNDDEVTEILINVLRVEENDLTLWTIIEVLGIKGTETAIPHLRDLLNSSISPLTRRELEKSIQLIKNRIPTSKTQNEQNIINEDDEESDLTQHSKYNKVIEEVKTEDKEQDVDELITEQFDQTAENSDTNEIDSDIIDISIENDVKIEDPISEETTKSSHTKDIDDTSEVIFESKQKSVHRQEKSNKNPTTPSLPVLVPNTSVVIYDQQAHVYQPNIFDLVLRPNEYLSKRWVSRTRLYFVVFCLLIVSTIALVYSQVQRQPHSPYSSRSKLAFVTDPKPYFEDGGLFLPTRRLS